MNAAEPYTCLSFSCEKLRKVQMGAWLLLRLEEATTLLWILKLPHI